MQVKRSFLLYLPTSYLQAIDEHIRINPPAFNYNKMYFYYIIHDLTLKHLRRPKNTFVNINMKKLKLKTVSNIDRYVSYLRNEDLLMYENYSAGNKSYKYRINEFANDDVTILEVEPNTRLYKKLAFFYNGLRTNYSRDLSPELMRMKDFCFNVDIDYKRAKEWTNNNLTGFKKYSCLVSLSALENKKQRTFSRNKTNKRLDTSFTVLKSEMRQFICGNYVSIDLTNSQILFLIILLNNIHKGNTLCSYLDNDSLIKRFGIQILKDVSKILQKGQKTKNHLNDELLNLKNQCVNGVFYDEFLKHSSVKTRDEVKDLMFGVIFSKNIDYDKKTGKPFVPYAKNKQIFRELYPLTMAMIEALKKKKHNKLAIHLQRAESFIFIDTICPRLVESGIVPLTIHDSVIVPADQQDKALEIVKQVFSEQFGIVPSFHVKPLKDDM